MTGDPQVSVVIVTWNSRPVVLDCLDSLVANPPSVPWGVVVANNANRGVPAAKAAAVAMGPAAYERAHRGG